MDETCVRWVDDSIHSVACEQDLDGQKAAADVEQYQMRHAEHDGVTKEADRNQDMMTSVGKAELLVCVFRYMGIES